MKPIARKPRTVFLAFLITSVTVFAYVGVDLGHALARMLIPDAAQFIEGKTGSIPTDRLTLYSTVSWIGWLISIGLGVMVARGLYLAWAWSKTE